MHHIANLLKMVEPLILSDGGCSREEANPETNCNTEMVCLQKNAANSFEVAILIVGNSWR